MKIDKYENLNRRTFLLESLGVLTGVGIAISACGRYDSSPTLQEEGTVGGEISANHGHQASLTQGQLASSEEITLNIRGASGHPHTVRLSANELLAIGQRERVSKISSQDDGHTHVVTFN